MNRSQRRLAAVFCLLVAAPVTLSALPQHAVRQPPASEIVLRLDPTLSKVHWTLGSSLHTVHGSFAFKKGILQLDTSTGKAGGGINMGAASGNSANDSRHKKNPKTDLQTAPYAQIIF